MLQIYVYDDTGASFELDLYKEDPLKITLSAEDIGDIPRINSAFSKQFRVPATQTNSRVFKWWYEVNTVDFDVTKRVRADLYSDGLFYKSGHIRIQNAYVNQDTSQVDLELVFFGETRDFASQVGEITLPQLTDLHQYDHSLTAAYVQNSWTATDAPVRYILADKGYTYDGNNPPAPVQNTIALASWANRFTQMNHPITLGQFTPMVQAKAIIDAIFAQTDYTYSADSFFNDNLFKQLYVDGIPFPSVTVIEEPALFRAESTGQELSIFGGTDFVEFTNEINDPTNSYNPLTSFYFPPIAANYTMATSVNLSLGRNLAHPSPDYRVRIIQGSTILLDSGTISAPAGIGRYKVTVNLSGIVSLLQFNGNTPTLVSVQVTVSNSNNNNDIEADSVFEVTNVDADAVSVPSIMKYDVKSLDFLKSILTKFKMIMVPSPDNEYEFIVKPWKDYMSAGDRFDWTNKLDVSKDVSLRPIFYEQSQIISLTDLQDEDHMNKPFQDEYNRAYGALQFDSQNDLLAGTRKVETIFAPTPVNLVEGSDEATSEFVIPFFSKLGDEPTSHGHLQHIPMRPKLRLLFWNGIATIPVGERWYYTDGTTTYNSSQAPLNDGYPRMTPYSEFPTTSTTLNINWFREIPLFPNGEALLGESVYERYWNKYVQELYSPLARVFTGYFNLDSNDLRTISFDDVIFIQNAYYRILKIYDAPITETQTVKVDLVKILDTITFANNGNPNPSGGGIDDVIVVGGGGSPALDDEGTWGGNDNDFGDDNNTWGGGVVEYYYQAIDCDGILSPITVKSVSPLAIGVVISVSGSAYAGTCWTISDLGTAPEDTTVLDVFASCAECQSL